MGLKHLIEINQPCEYKSRGFNKVTGNRKSSTLIKNKSFSRIEARFRFVRCLEKEWAFNLYVC